ncbi:hypothetical protein Hanom_Chr00s011431g01747461 [Helianthus anomalus]
MKQKTLYSKKFFRHQRGAYTDLHKVSYFYTRGKQKEGTPANLNPTLYHWSPHHLR